MKLQSPLKITAASILLSAPIFFIMNPISAVNAANANSTINQLDKDIVTNGFILQCSDLNGKVGCMAVCDDKITTIESSGAGEITATQASNACRALGSSIKFTSPSGKKKNSLNQARKMKY